MKHISIAIILKREQIGENYFLLELGCKDIAHDAKPGQFIMLECKGEAFLKRPMGLSSVDPEKGAIGFIYQVCGMGTRALHELPLGEIMDAIGPLGNSFWIEQNARSVGLIAGGTGIGPLLMFAKALHETAPNVEVVGFIGGKNASIAFGKNEMQKTAREVFIATDDGSLGDKGFVTDALSSFLKKRSLDSIVACGPTPMMKKASEIARERNIICQVSLEEHMACGFGACLGCPCEIRDRGYIMICKEGTVFNARDIIW